MRQPQLGPAHPLRDREGSTAIMQSGHDCLAEWPWVQNSLLSRTGGQRTGGHLISKRTERVRSTWFLVDGCPRGRRIDSPVTLFLWTAYLVSLPCYSMYVLVTLEAEGATIIMRIPCSSHGVHWVCSSAIISYRIVSYLWLIQPQQAHSRLWVAR